MKKTKVYALILALVMMVSILPAKALHVSADEAGEKIREARNGVLLVVAGVTVTGSKEFYPVSFGSGFLIGSTETKQYIVTNYHVIDIDDYKEDVAKKLNVTPKNLKTVLRAVVTTSGATSELEYNSSYATIEKDLAVLGVKDKIFTSRSLVLSDDDNIAEADTVWALGYPYDKTTFGTDFPTYKNEDVDMQKGSVTKFVTMNGVKCIQHSANLQEGSSGGPLVDENGYVVGVDAYGFGDGNTFESIRINYVKELLDTFGIQYDKVGEEIASEPSSEETTEPAEEITTEEPAPTVDKSGLQSAIETADGKNADEYKKESYDNFSKKLETAKEVMDDESASQEDVNDALNALNLASDNLDPKSNTMLFMVAGAVAVVLLIILAVILATRKKKPAVSAVTKPVATPPQPAPIPQPTPMPQAAPIPQAPPAGGFYGDGAGETSVLNEGAGETTILSNQNMIQAYLFRESNSENIKINKSIFAIGRERKKVDYCVSDNNSVGRNHAEIILKNNKFYLIDQKSTNGTYLNGVKVSPLQEMELKNGDKIRLSDEEFVFKMI